MRSIKVKKVSCKKSSPHLLGPWCHILGQAYPGWVDMERDTLLSRLRQQLRRSRIMLRRKKKKSRKWRKRWKLSLLRINWLNRNNLQIPQDSKNRLVALFQQLMERKVKTNFKMQQTPKWILSAASRETLKTLTMESQIQVS